MSKKICPIWCESHGLDVGETHGLDVGKMHGLDWCCCRKGDTNSKSYGKEHLKIFKISKKYYVADKVNEWGGGAGTENKNTKKKKEESKVIRSEKNSNWA